MKNQHQIGTHKTNTLPYPRTEIKFKHYGKNVHSMVKKLQNGRFGQKTGIYRIDWKFYEISL
ncbi:MAG: DUF4290 domain-containing protein [Bacteroidetes bacterium]|nr:DUF4290 domain-containing protein [Bacteroidota bacterium]